MLSNFFFAVLNKHRGFYINNTKLLEIHVLFKDRIHLTEFPYIEETLRRKGVLKYK